MTRIMIFTSHGEDTPVRPTDEGKVQYEHHHGAHFTARLADYAVSHLRNITSTQNHLSRERIREHLRAMALQEPRHFEDFYVLCNEVFSDYYPDPIKTEADVVRGAYRYMVDDPDTYEGALFHRFCFDALRKGEHIEWEHYI